MAFETVTIAKIKRPEPRTFTIYQPGTIPPRPEWMKGAPGYVESVARTCPKCHSNHIWRGVWCTVSEIYLRLERMKPPVKHTGRKRHSACLDCGEFRTDIQAIPYTIEDWVDDEQ